MRMLAAENWNANARGTFIIFETTSVGGIYPAERVRISAEGNVGIGTSSPASRLHVVQVASSITTPRGIIVDNYSGIGNPGVAPQINQRSARGTPATPSAVAQGDGLADFSGGGYDGTNFAQQAHIRMLAAENWTTTARGTHITLETTPIGSVNPAERMRITAGGYVGIGIANPISILHILQIAPPNQNPRGIIIDNYSGTGNPGVAPQINQRSARGTPTSPGALLSNDILANYSGGGWYGTDFSQQALMRMYAREDWTATNRGTFITLETTPTGGIGVVRRFLLDHNGFAYFNPPNINTFPNNPIVVGYDNTNGNGAHVTAGGAWTNGSSRLFKDRGEILDPQAVLQKIRNLSVEGWYYKGTEEYHIGPYAEDFHAAFGTGDRSRPEFSAKYLAASDIASVALLGTKALLERLERLEAENAALKAHLQELRARLETK